MQVIAIPIYENPQATSVATGCLCDEIKGSVGANQQRWLSRCLLNVLFPLSRDMQVWKIIHPNFTRLLSPVIRNKVGFGLDHGMGQLSAQSKRCFTHSF